MAVHIIYAVIIVVGIYPWLSNMARSRIERHWNKGLMNLFNIKSRVSGVAPDLTSQNVMLVSNHVSWLDIYLLNTIRPVKFVSKLEVRSWPVVGFLASKTGTMFIDRTKRHDTKRVTHEMSTVLKNGGCVAVFPEGTTSNGTKLLPFHASLLQSAVVSQSKVCPVAIRYSYADGSLNMAPAYIDELTFADSVLLILSQAVIYADLIFLSPISVHNKTRRELTQEAELAVAKALNLSVATKAPSSCDLTV
jgi:1-acyl-sn-glycerol-3-phosphate acyltransferase